MQYAVAAVIIAAASAAVFLFFLSSGPDYRPVPAPPDAPSAIPSSKPTPAFATPTPLFAKPAGIYAVVAVNEPQDYDAAGVRQLLGNNATSGIALRERWKNLEPAEGGYDFSRIDDAVASASAAGKTVQLILVPGFFSPEWVLDSIQSCDGYLDRSAEYDQSQSAQCGKATFEVPYGPDGGGTMPLPLPWDETYKRYWQGFLEEVANRYRSNRAVVSIAVAGPTSVSAEMSMPDDVEKWRKILELVYPKKDPHRDSNLAITEEWGDAINLYAATFHDKTVIVTMGSGLVKFGSDGPQQAKDRIMDQFVQAPSGNNYKGIQTSGLKACRGFDGGIGRAKELTLQGISGGAQFNSAATGNPGVMGCADKDFCSQDEKKQLCKKSDSHPCCQLTPAQAVRNVLAAYFEKTPFGRDYGAEDGDYLPSYLQVYDKDILFANADSEVQQIFQDASKDILTMSNCQQMGVAGADCAESAT